MGLIIPRAAEAFGVDAVSMAAQFTWLTGGIFFGYILSMGIFDRFTIKQVLIGSYLICVLALLLIHFSTNYNLLAVWLALFGVAISMAVCGSGTLITRLWDGRARQTVLVAQDAMFNGGGVIFAAIATWFAGNAFAFSATYLVVAAIIVCVLILVIIANFDSSDFVIAHNEKVVTQWNFSFLLIGFSLLLFMTAKISIFIWAPQYVEAKFGVGAEDSGRFMGNIFTAALVGSLVGTWLVSRIKVKILLYALVLVAGAATIAFTRMATLESMMIIALFFGVSISATFNAYMAFALTLVKIPTHRNIAYMLLMSGLGSAIAPLVSSQAVARGGEIEYALYICAALFLMVILTLFASEFAVRNRTSS